MVPVFLLPSRPLPRYFLGGAGQGMIDRFVHSSGLPQELGGPAAGDVFVPNLFPGCRLPDYTPHRIAPSATTTVLANCENMSVCASLQVYHTFRERCHLVGVSITVRTFLKGVSQHPPASSHHAL